MVNLLKEKHVKHFLMQTSDHVWAADKMTGFFTARRCLSLSATLGYCAQKAKDCQSLSSTK